MLHYACGPVRDIHPGTPIQFAADGDQSQPPGLRARLSPADGRSVQRAGDHTGHKTGAAPFHRRVLRVHFQRQRPVRFAEFPCGLAAPPNIVRAGRPGGRRELRVDANTQRRAAFQIRAEHGGHQRQRAYDPVAAAKRVGRLGRSARDAGAGRPQLRGGRAVAAGRRDAAHQRHAPVRLRK